LYEHYLFRNIPALLWSAKAKEIAKPRVSFLVSVCNPHSTPNSNIKTFEPAIFPDNGDEANVISEDVDIVGWRDRYCDFELERS
jgi:hypothetical protein